MKRALKVVAKIAIVLVVLRAVVWIALPIGVSAALHSYELEGEWDSISLSVFAGELEVRDLTIRDQRDTAKSGEPLVALDYADFDLSMKELLHGRPCVERAEIDGLHLFAERAKDGSIGWVKRLGLDQPAPPKPKPDPKSPPPSKALDFTLPVEVRALRLQHVELHVADASVEPPLDATIVANVRVSDLGRSDRAATIECFATSERSRERERGSGGARLFDSARVSGSEFGGARKLDLSLALELDGFEPAAIAGFLAPLGIVPKARSIGCGAQIAVAISPETDSTDGSKVAFAVRGIHVLADGEKELSIEDFEIDAPLVSFEKAEVSKILVDRVEARASRSSSGNLRVTGFEFVGGAAASQSSPAQTAKPGEASASKRFELALGQVLVQNVAVAFRDEAVTPQNEISLALASFDVKNVTIGGDTEEPITLGGRLSADGLFRSAEFGGTLDWTAPNANASISAHVVGLEPARAAPYLAALGLKSELVDASLSIALQAHALLAKDAPPEVSVELGEVRLENHDPKIGAATLFDLDRLSLGKAKFDAATNSIDVAELALTHLATGARRDKDGKLHALGFEIGEAPKSVATNIVVAKSPSTLIAPLSIPKLHVAHVAATNTELRFEDATVEPASVFATTDFGGEIIDLTIGGDAPMTASIKGSLVIPGLVARASVDGTVTSKPGALDLATKLALRADGLKLTSLAPYLKPLGVEPLIDDGSAKANVSFELARIDDAWVIGADLNDLEIVNGGVSLASLGSLRVTNATFGESGAIHVHSIEVAKARTSIARDENGALVAVGMRMSQKVANAAAPPNDADAPLSLEFTLPNVRVDSAHIDGASVAWNDATISPSVACTARIDAKLDPLAVGVRSFDGSDVTPESAFTKFDVALAISDSLTELRAQGRAVLDPAHLYAQGTVRAQGLKAGALAAYAPRGIHVELADGEAKSSFRLASAIPPGGGRSIDCVVSDVELNDRKKALVKFDDFAFVATRVDPAAGGYEIRNVVLRGAQLSARRTSDGTLHALGLAIETSTPDDASPAATPTRRTSVSKSRVERISIDNVELELAKLEFTDETKGANSEPLVANAKFTLGKSVLFDATPQDLKPIEFKLTSSISPLADQIVLDAKVSPFASDPEMDAKLAVHGIHGDGLTKLIPALADKLDGSALTAGEFGADFKAVLKLVRKSLTEFDFSKSFGADLSIENVAFRQSADGDVLAGLQSAHADVTKVDPASGDVLIKSIELTKPIGRVSRDANGIHALGFTLMLPKPSADAPAVAAETPASAPTPPSVAVDVPKPAERKPELAIDRIGVSGLDFTLTDSTATPPLVANFTDLDLEVRKFTTRAFSEPKPIHFSVFVGAGKTSLPVRVDSSDALSGTLKAVGDVASGRHEELKFEDRPLFDEVAINGRLAFYPELNGWVTLGVGALELPAFRGIVAANGITLGDGLLDASVRVRLQGERGMSVEARPSFSYLSLSEPAGGPISKYLALPAPLDTVLFLLKDSEGQHKVPVNFHIGREGLTTSEIVSAAAGAVTSVIARAVAGAPLRVLGSVGGLFGIGGGEEPPPSKDAIEISFAPGVALFGDPERERLAKLVEKLGTSDKLVVAVQNKLSASDLSRAEELANPDLGDCRDLSSRLREKKSELVRRREVLAAEARVHYAVGRTKDAAAATDELRSIDRELGLNEDALDHLHELLRPGAERRRDQRTRSAALSIAVERVARVKQALVELGLAPERIEVRSIRVAVEPGAERGSISLVPHKRK